ncbi:hypothetical protein [Aureivirga sp. CE67]|uniref:hypothetical protein n=1 Tax=Aureivirga sp. CE67 TaxID=1788983 RepID=UPI0018CB8D43|nr:hypothetical protein [Aureivirga sp. CE67]
MKEYRFSEENAKKMMKTRTISRIPTILIAIVFGLYIANLRGQGEVFGNSLVLVLTLSISLVALSIGIFIGMKKGAEALKHNVYRISDTGIERKTSIGKSINIDFDKVESYKSMKKGLLIKTKNQKILIPTELDNYTDLSSLILEKVK